MFSLFAVSIVLLFALNIGSGYLAMLVSGVGVIF